MSTAGFTKALHVSIAVASTMLSTTIAATASGIAELPRPKVQIVVMETELATPLRNRSPIIPPVLTISTLNPRLHVPASTQTRF